jgi:hypothetical protein
MGIAEDGQASIRWPTGEVLKESANLLGSSASHDWKVLLPHEIGHLLLFAAFHTPASPAQGERFYGSPTCQTGSTKP